MSFITIRGSDMTYVPPSLEQIRICDGSMCFSVLTACFFFILQPKSLKYKTGLSDLVIVKQYIFFYLLTLNMVNRDSVFA